MANGSLPQFGNIYAPPWMGVSPILRGIRDQDYDLDLPPVTIAPATVSRGNAIPVDTDGDLLVREFQFQVIATSGGVPAASDIRVRLRDGDGRLYTSDFVPIVDMNGPAVGSIAWPLRRGSVVLVDYQNVGAATVTVWMVMKCWKRIECPGDPTMVTPPYMPMYARYTQQSATADLDDFEYPFVFTQAAAGDLLKIPLQTDNDADFLWRGISGDWNTVNNDVAVVGSVGVTFYDVGGLPLSLTPLANPWGSGTCGQFRELVFSSGGGRPAPFYPEIFIPRGGVVSVDLSFGPGFSQVRFSLRGVKVYGSCS